MESMGSIPVKELSLDLHNYRTVPQGNEVHAINTIIATSADRFLALMNSILDDGYYPSESIIVLKKDGKQIVKEGNRRIAALKIILGIVKGIKISDECQEKIDGLNDDWKKNNSSVPCTIYDQSESEQVEKLVSLIHAKGEQAGRERWNSVAKARFERDQKGKTEPGLDLLEKYLENGRNCSDGQKERWSGGYPLTVLDEVLQKLKTPFGCETAKDLIESYPKKNKKIMDKILLDIGTQEIGFKEVRDTTNLFKKYKIPELKSPTGKPGETPAPTTQKPSGPFAEALNDPKSVYKVLKSFKPVGNGREKIVTLLNEMNLLKIDRHPHAFCFLLRSIFELSAEAYCADKKTSGGPCPQKKDGSKKSLSDLLREITQYMIKNSDKEKVKLLHGAMAELGKASSILSVTSMNQLVHSKYFSIQPSDISILFHNIFPLLVEMNT